MKPLVIVNPRSGGGATGRTFDAMRGRIEAQLGDVDVAQTERPRHATSIAADAARDGRSLVVAIGGDGTFHEVVNGLMSVADRTTELGLIGQGTGGDFRKTLGLEHQLDAYVTAIASGRRKAIDVGKFSGGGRDDHYFVNILSAGMGGLVDQYVATASRALGGTFAYFGASLRALIRAKLGDLRIRVTHEGTTEEKRVRSYMIAICNGRFFGSGMEVAPMAAVDDGVFEVVALGPTSKLDFARRSNGIYSGKHMQEPDTVHLRGSKIEIDLLNETARDVYLLDVDGEPMGSLPLVVEVIPKALVVRC